jgi:formate dehydrogenase subunit delta
MRSAVHNSTTDKLVMQANQIAAFFAAQGEERAIPQIAAHIAQFWDPRMRALMRSHLASGGAGLQPLTRAALDSLDGVPASDGRGAAQPPTRP